MLKQTEVKAIVPDSPTGTAVKAVPEVQTGQMISPTLADSKDLMRKLGSRNASVRVEAQQSLKYLDVTTLLSLMASQRRLAA